MRSVELIVFDLDGTLLNTEQLVEEVTKAVVQRHGKSLTLEAMKVCLVSSDPVAEAYEACGCRHEIHYHYRQSFPRR